MTPDEKLDHRAMGKGRYNNLSAAQVAERDPGYLVWAYETWSPKPCSALLYRECVNDVAEARNQSRVSRDQDREL